MANPYYGNAPSVSPFGKNGLRRVVTVGLVDNTNNRQVDAQVWKRVYDVFEDREYLVGIVFSFTQTDATEAYFGDDPYADGRNRYLVSNVTANVSAQKVSLDDDGGDSTPTPAVETVVVTRTVTKTVVRTPERTPTPTTTAGPGLGTVAGALALLAAALLFARRRR